MVEPTQAQMKRMQEIELDMLRAFVEVCQKLSLRYYLVGGTLLGAIRHQGFIPWDDDIDISMPRADYEIFLREGQTHLPEHLFLQSIYSEPEYHLNFAKIRDSRTTFVEYAVRKRKIHHGVFIDIFPLDAYPQDPKARKTMDRYQKLFKYRLRAEVEIPDAARHSRAAETVLTAMEYVSRLCYPNFRKMLEERERIQSAAQGEDIWVNYCGTWGQREIMPAEWYGAGTEVTFEGMTVMGPSQWENWLTQIYGAYMQLPPLEKRVSHHYAERIALDTPWGEKS